MTTDRRTRSGGRKRLFAVPILAGLILASCGGDDDSSDADTAAEAEDTGDETAVEQDTAAEEDTADTGAEEDTAEMSEEDTAEMSDEDTADTASDEDTAEMSEEDTAEMSEADTGEMSEEMTPVRGGTLTYLLEAETDTWNIPSGNCAVSCITVMRQVAEPLMVVNDQGVPEPFLLESIESNDDFTEYTMVMRDGITFHDGTPADGAALQRNLQEMAQGALQGQVLQDLVGGPDGVELVDPMTVRVTFSSPFVSFPGNISDRTGYLLAPSFWDDPDRAGALAVGTGPFEMTEWVRDEQTVLTAYPDYWRTDGNGEQLPYLDGIVFRPIPDVSTRRATMEAGDADANHDSFAENREFWTTEWIDNGGHLVEPAIARETTYLLINNEKPPFDDPDFRRAVALCTDRGEYITFRSPGSQIANGPFAEGSLGYLEDPGFPAFDLEAGNALLDEIGRQPIIYGTTDVASNLLTAELFTDMWSTNCGLETSIDQFDQSEFITRAITGDFQMFLWRNHGQGDPGLEFVWWHSRHADGLALNFGRIRNPELDALLEQVQATTDDAEKDEIGQQINMQFAENVNNIWLNTSEWFNPYQENVHGVGVLHLPSGNLGQTAIAGRTWLQEAWKEG